LFANALASRDSARVPNVTRSYVGKDVRYGEECDFRYCEGFRMPARDGAATAPELRFGFCLTVSVPIYEQPIVRASFFDEKPQLAMRHLDPDEHRANFDRS
jgi:hypothetical protein